MSDHPRGERRQILWKAFAGPRRRPCAIAEKYSLPALEAAHIKPYGESSLHPIHNGLLLRSDVHRLFDSGYITVCPDYCIEIRRRRKEEFNIGLYYHPFHGHRVHHLQCGRCDWPSKEMLTGITQLSSQGESTSEWVNNQEGPSGDMLFMQTIRVSLRFPKSNNDFEGLDILLGPNLISL